MEIVLTQKSLNFEKNFKKNFNFGKIQEKNYL